MLREFLPRSRGGQTLDFLIAAPYVDNGDSFPESELKELWGEEALDVFGFRGVHHHREPHSLRARRKHAGPRNITLFFGGCVADESPAPHTLALLLARMQPCR